MQPTLFSTAAENAAGGVSLTESGIISGGSSGRAGARRAGGGGDRGEGMGGEGGVGVTGGGAVLLSASEKIEELEALVESSRTHNQRWEGRIMVELFCDHGQGKELGLVRDAV